MQYFRNFSLSLSSILFLSLTALAQQTPRAVPGEYLIKFKASSGGVARAHRKLQGKASLKASFPGMGIMHVSMKQDANEKVNYESLKNDADIEFIEPNYILEKSKVAPNGPGWYGYKRISSIWSDTMLAAKLVIIALTKISIEYSINNTSAEKIYIFERVFERASNGEPIVRPELAYCSLLDNNVLLVEKAMQIIPTGMKVEIPEIPYLIEINPGQTFSGRILLSLPIKEFNAYLSTPTNKTDLVVKKILLRIGYIQSSDIKEKAAVLISGPHGQAGVYAANYGYAKELQRFLEVDLGYLPDLPQKRQNF